MTTKCGVLAISNSDKNYCSIIDFIHSLNKLQHRGQESCGISYLIKDNFFCHKEMGLVKDVFKDALESNTYKPKHIPKYIIGHTRYSTSGTKSNKEIQPYSGYNNTLGKFCFTFNGNIPFLNKYKDLVPNFTLDENYLDTNFIKKFFENPFYESWERLCEKFVREVEKAYCIILLTTNGLYTIRDPYGVRPLCIGENEKNFCISSESCALLKYKYVRYIKPGELIHIKEDKLTSIDIFSKKITANCLFEHIYFLNQDSQDVKTVREKFGELMAYRETLQESINDKEEFLVCGVPTSGIISAQSYAKHLNLNYKQFIVKNKKINRTFILKNNEERDNASKQKYKIIDNYTLKDKHIIIIDDSIVRGITMKNLINQLWEVKPKTIHIRISSPPVKYPCYYGVDIPDKKTLIAYSKSESEIESFYKVNSLKYLSINDLKIYFPEDKACYGCFNLNYNNDW